MQLGGGWLSQPLVIFTSDSLPDIYTHAFVVSACLSIRQEAFVDPLYSIRAEL